MIELYYVFGVLSENTVVKSAETITHAGLKAIFERVPEDEFGEQYLSNNLKNMEWVSEKVVHHQSVLDQLQGAEPLIPFKFGSIFKTEEGLKEMLLDRKEDFAALIEKLRGKQEWGVKLFYDSAKLTEWAEKGSDEIILFNKQIDEGSAGKAFLLKKKKQEALNKLCKQQINDYRKRVFGFISDRDVEVYQNKELESGLTGRPDTNILNLAILSEASNTQKLMSFIDELQPALIDRGMKLELTGPWPPYNFVSE